MVFIALKKYTQIRDTSSLLILMLNAECHFKLTQDNVLLVTLPLQRFRQCYQLSVNYF